MNRIICIAGKNRIAVDALNFLLDNGVLKSDILACVNKTDNGVHQWQPSFKLICEQNGIKICNISDLYKVENLVFFSLEYDKIIKPSYFISNKLYNIHFSKLPAYKGMYTSIMPILYNEEYSGVTLHKIDAGIDTGDIIDQTVFKMPDRASSYEVYRLYLQSGIELFKKNFNKIISGDFSMTIQNINGASYYSKSSIDFQNLYIDLNKTAFQVKNQIRAFTFRPYQLLKFQDIPIVSAKIEDQKSVEKPGEILEQNEYSFLVSTIDFNIRLYKDKLTILLEVAKDGIINKLDELFHNEYNLSDKNKFGWDALIVASYYEQFDFVKRLLQYGADPNVSNNNETSALMYSMTAATKSNNLKIMDLLINEGADVYHKDYKGNSIYYYAKKLGNELVIDYIGNKLNNIR